MRVGLDTAGGWRHNGFTMKGTNSATGIAKVDSIVAEVAAGIDTRSASATRGQCHRVSMDLAARLDGVELLDEDGDVDSIVEAWTVQLWDAPEAIAECEMVAGHYVVMIRADHELYAIDLTAAQFGFVGPRIATGTKNVTWSDFTDI